MERQTQPRVFLESSGMILNLSPYLNPDDRDLSHKAETIIRITKGSTYKSSFRLSS